MQIQGGILCLGKSEEKGFWICLFLLSLKKITEENNQEKNKIIQKNNNLKNKKKKINKIYIYNFIFYY